MDLSLQSSISVTGSFSCFPLMAAFLSHPTFIRQRTRRNSTCSVMVDTPCARDGTYVCVHIEGRLESGEEVVNRDISLTLGRGHAYRSFEEAVHGLHVGETRTVKLRVPSQERALISKRTATIGNAGDNDNISDSDIYVALSNGMVAKQSSSGATLDCNDELAGRVMDVSVTLNSMDGRQLPSVSAVWAIFSGGSFLSLEAILNAVPGVKLTRVGYAGGSLRNAEYVDVIRGDSGHFESVAVAYDPLIVSYEELLNIYAAYIHIQLKKSSDANDIGAQYGKAIFCTDEAQFDLACKWRADLNAKTGRKFAADIRRIEARDMVVAEHMFQSGGG